MAKTVDPDLLKKALEGALEIDFPGYKFNVTLNEEAVKRAREKRAAEEEKKQ